jgi:hypothetical protein
MKYFLTILCIFLSSWVYAAPGTRYKVTMKDGSVRMVSVSKIDKDGSLILTDNSKIPVEEIQNIRLLFDTSNKKHIIIVDNNGSPEYIDGVIAFRDLKRFTVVDDREKLNIFSSNQMLDIINREYFYQEISKTREKALGLSAIYPGEGQRYNGRDITGYIIFTTSVVTGALAFKSYIDSNKAYKDYQKSGNIDFEAYRKHQSLVRKTNQYSLLLLTTYLYNLYDAYYGYRELFPYKKYKPPDEEITKENEVSLFSYTIHVNW